MRKPTVLFIVAAALLAACSPKSKSPPAASAAAPPASSPASPDAAPKLTDDQRARLVRMHSPVLGPAAAQVTVVEFLDPACEACAAFAPVIRNIRFLYPDDVRVVVRYAAFHEGSAEAIRLLVAAQEQRKYETVLDALFEQQADWASHHAPDVEAAWMIAGKAGLDVPRARRTAKSPQTDAVLKQESEDVIEIRVERTPTLFVNGRPLSNFSAAAFMALVKEEVTRAKSPATPAS